MPSPILIPLINPNEPEASLVAIHVIEGQHVTAGELLFTLETTKSTAEVTAEGDGYIIGMGVAQRQTVRAGDIFAYLAGTPETPVPDLPSSDAIAQSPNQTIPAGLRITQPALALAQQLGLELSVFPAGALITEKMIRDRAETARRALPTIPFDSTAILIYGGGGHGKALIDLIRALGAYRIAGLVDNGRSVGDLVMGLPVLGDADVLARMYAQGVRLAVNAVGGIGNIGVRIKVFHQLAEAGFACPALIHPSAVVEASAVLCAGVQVFPMAYIGSEAEIGYGAIVNTGAIVSHDCTLGDYANISPGAMLAGNVEVGESALIGMGVTVNLHVKIGAGARIGNSATVKADVPPGGVVRAGAIWPE